VLIAVLSVANAAAGTKRGDRLSSAEPSTARLLTSAEGRALIDFARQHPIADQAPDCSHLVHQTLNDAGLVYQYATSFEIFAGIPQFQRVRHPQAGDLIVWPGHVGLVVDPHQTTFFSSTGSGPRTDQYTSDYWRHRGYPRFYRYLVTGTTELAARLHVEKQSSDTAIDADVDDRPRPGDRSYIAEAPEFPEKIQIVSEHASPTKLDIEEAVSELTDVSASALDAAQRKSMPVIFVRSWKVDKVKLKGDQGWVQLRVQSSDERNPDGTWKKSRVQKLRCELRRDQAGWVLFPPLDRLYVTAQSR
jgi:hypothetical protein